MKNTDCVKNGNDFKHCLKESKECAEYRNAYFTCKRSGLDMRTRIRGPKVY